MCFIKCFRSFIGLMGIDRKKLTWMKDLFTKTETLTSPVDLDKFIDGSVRDKAIATAGPKG